MQLPTLQLGPPEDGWQEAPGVFYGSGFLGAESEQALLQRLRSGAGRGEARVSSPAQLGALNPCKACWLLRAVSGTPSRVDLAGAPNLSPAERLSLILTTWGHVAECTHCLETACFCSWCSRGHGRFTSRCCSTAQHPACNTGPVGSCSTCKSMEQELFETTVASTSTHRRQSIARGSKSQSVEKMKLSKHLGQCPAATAVCIRT